MLAFILAGAAALWLGGAFGGVKLCCRPVESYCWIKNPLLCRAGGFERPCDAAWRDDPVATCAAFLNNPFIIDRYRGRTAYQEDLVRDGDRAWVMLRFGDGEKMGFELCRNCRGWTVCAYCYPENCQCRG
ncbi:MAG: hypothetical protein IJV00_02560 [Clostridia bacterium]|nr:hypothetical protein [Clostridia bacterium]